MPRSIVIETVIARPPHEVFDYLRDFSNLATWQGARMIEATTEPPGPARVGTRIRTRRRGWIGKQDYDYQVTEVDEGQRRLRDAFLNGPFRGTNELWQVLDDAGGSRVLYVAQLFAHGLFWAPLLPVIHRAADSQLRGEFEFLKQTLESRPTD